MATRPTPAPLTATRGMPRSTPTASWSPRPPPPPAMSATRPPHRSCWRAGRPGPRRPAGTDRSLGGSWWAAGPRSTVTAPMAPGRCWPACTPPASTHGSRSKPRSRPAGTSPRTSSGSTLTPGSSPAPPAHRPDHLQPRSAPSPSRPGQLRAGLRGLPASRPVHRRGRRPHHHHHRLRARAGRCPGPPGRPRPGWRLPRDPTQGGAKLAHLVRRRHGGRRVRVRGLAKVAADFNLLAAAVNLARLGVLGLHWTPSDGWAAA